MESTVSQHQTTESSVESSKKRQWSTVNGIRPVFKFEVLWDPSKVMGTPRASILHNVLISPYCGQSRAEEEIHSAELLETNPLRSALDVCRENGLQIVTGYWKYPEKPIAIMVDLNSISEENINKYCDELKRDFFIDIPQSDIKCRKSVAFGYAVAELLNEFEKSIGTANLSRKSYVRFHDWTAAAGAIFLSRWYKPLTEILFGLSKTQLRSLKPKHPIEAQLMAREANVLHRHMLEFTATNFAKHIVLVYGLNAKAVHKQLSKVPSYYVQGARSSGH